jgi:hypothetical protein
LLNSIAVKVLKLLKEGFEGQPEPSVKHYGTKREIEKMMENVGKTCPKTLLNTCRIIFEIL